MLKIGGRFGDYTVEALLGQGGMGEVYRIRGENGATFAVKVMKPPEGEEEHEFRRRFAREAEIAMKVNHRNLIKVYDVGEDPETGLCYIIMDYVPGGSVAQKLKAQGRLSIETALTVAIKIAAALSKAHKAGVVHRDIKPDNIMFDEDGTPKLADLGIAKFEDGREVTQLTSTGVVIGTPAYMAPEQMLDSHNVTPKADIYSLGMVLYEMLTGERPHGDSSVVELMSKALKGEELRDVRELRPEVPDALARVIRQMCARNPGERPADAQAVVRMLNAAAESIGRMEGGRCARMRLAFRSWRHRKSTKKLMKAVLGLMVALAMVGVGFVVGERGSWKCENVEISNTNIQLPMEEELENMDEEQEEKVEESVWARLKGFKVKEEEAAKEEPVEEPVVAEQEKAQEETKQEEIEEPKQETMEEEKEEDKEEDEEKEGVGDGDDDSDDEQSKPEEQTAQDGQLVWEGWKYSLSKGWAIIEGWAGKDIPEKLTLPPAVGGETVYKIGREAFAGCKQLKSVTIPSEVKVIGEKAFFGCTALESVEIENGSGKLTIGKKAFAKCTNLWNISFCGKWTKIGKMAFAHCRSLQEVKLPGNIETMAPNAFYGCAAIRRVTIPKYLCSRKKAGMRGVRLAFPHSYAWITHIEVQDGVEKIFKGTFAGCIRLESVKIPESVTYMSEEAFDKNPPPHLTIYVNKFRMDNFDSDRHGNKKWRGIWVSSW